MGGQGVGVVGAEDLLLVGGGAFLQRGFWRSVAAASASLGGATAWLIKYGDGSMSADSGAILIAAIGVLGTLVSPIVSQRLSARARHDEFEMQKSERLEARQLEQQQLAFANKRSCYIALMANARRYRVEMMNYLYAAKSRTVDNDQRNELEAARRAYIMTSAEAQMTASLRVLAMIEAFNADLYKGYRATKHLEEGEPEPDGSFEETESFLTKLWDQWDDMREAMRQDLNIED